MAATPGPDMQEPHHDDVLEYVEQFTDEKCQPFAQTTDVSERFSSVSKRTIYGRLDELADWGQLEKRKVGANSTVWWPAGQECV